MTRMANSNVNSSRSDAWAATRGAILENDAANSSFPTYYSRANGKYIWDEGGTKYTDYILGYGPVVLGHANSDVNDAVAQQMQKGTCASPLWSPLQSELAERMCKIVPGAEQAYFMRTGSDATSAAVRLSRIHTGRRLVIRIGYNGWHDWCCPRPAGIPNEIADLSLHCEFNDSEHLARLLNEHEGDVAAVVIMSYGLEPPTKDFFQNVRDVCSAHGTVFVIDEMRSGFRIALGGAQEAFGFTADLATFSKAMANGFPISAVTGRSDIMRGLAETHMSSTYFGNAPEMAATLKTLDLLEEKDCLGHINRLGRRLLDGLATLVRDYSLPARTCGLPASPFLAFDELEANQPIRVRFYEEVLRRGMLLHPNHQWYISAEHTDNDIDELLNVCRTAAEESLKV